MMMHKTLKRTLFRFFFSIEVLCMVIFYLFGSQGMMALVRLKEEQKKIMSDVEQLCKANSLLQEQIVCWQNNDYFKEKEAREKLHMACPDEIVVYLPEGM
jgi:cell division protein FtsB